MRPKAAQPLPGTAWRNGLEGLRVSEEAQHLHSPPQDYPKPPGHFLVAGHADLSWYVEDFGVHTCVMVALKMGPFENEWWQTTCGPWVVQSRLVLSGLPVCHAVAWQEPAWLPRGLVAPRSTAAQVVVVLLCSQ